MRLWLQNRTFELGSVLRQVLQTEAGYLSQSHSQPTTSKHCLGTEGTGANQSKSTIEYHRVDQYTRTPDERDAASVGSPQYVVSL